MADARLPWPRSRRLTPSVVNNGQEVIRYRLSDVTVKNFSTSDGFFAETENITLQMQCDQTGATAAELEEGLTALARLGLISA